MSSQDQIKQQLSEFMDGELDEQAREHLIGRLNKDPGLCSRWQRYHLISDVIRSNIPPSIDKNFAARVSLALELEPIIFAPRTSPSTNNHWKKAAGFAVAASVAMLGVLGGLRLVQTDTTLSPQLAGNEPLPMLVAAASSQQPRIVSLAVPVSGSGQQAGRDPYLNRYLINHNVSAQGAGMYGVLPSARIVSYQQGR
ncbi:MAG: hypothetical protein A2V90_03635 [Gammaproteobacteria bacterium RBG_16_57_12]|nr:MAG: hypothetical protein A2V90_03635 [Gammaproteobacteria bacterium RBG_16_57_12]